MKKSITFTFVALFAIALFFSGCIKDSCHYVYTYTYYIPVYQTVENVRANIKSNQPEQIANPGKIFILGKYIFLNETDKGIHVIDNSNPSSPHNVAFIDIPGNMDMAVKGNILYADCYTDLVTLDITDPLNVIVKKITDGVFPYRAYSNGFSPSASQVIIDWIRKDTLMSENCDMQGLIYTSTPGIYFAGYSLQSASGQSNTHSPIGVGGSMARFALINNYLYTVGDNTLSSFDISNSVNPVHTNDVVVDWHVETIYPFNNKLFIGSNNGMFIYDVQSSPSTPASIGEFTHARACDPVIADDSFAFVTLHSGTDCLGYNNQLDVVKLNNLYDATLAKTYNFTGPQGISKDGNILFLCDGSSGLRVLDATDPLNLKPVKQFAGIEPYDVIAFDHLAIVVAKDGLYQYDYTNPDDIQLLSKTVIQKQ